MEATFHRPFTGTAFIVLGAAFLLLGAAFALLGIEGYGEEGDVALFATTFLVIGVAMATVGGSGIAAGAGGIRGRWGSLRVFGYAVATLYLIIGVMGLILTIDYDLETAATIVSIMFIAAGILGHVGGTFYRPGPRGLVGGVLVSVAALFIVVAAFVDDPLSSFVPGMLEDDATGILEGAGLLVAAVGMTLYAIPGRPGRLAGAIVLAAGALVWVAGHTVAAVDVLDDDQLFNTEGATGLQGPAIIVGSIATILVLVGALASLVAALLAIIGQASAGGAPAIDTGSRATPAPPARSGTRRLKCPRCQSPVEVPAGKRPKCPACGYGS